MKSKIRNVSLILAIIVGLTLGAFAVARLSNQSSSVEEHQINKLPDESEEIPGSWIVSLDSSVSPSRVAKRAAGKTGGQVGHVYEHALSGFAIEGIENAKALKNIPGVKKVEPDLKVYALSQTLPTGVDRIEADENETASIDGSSTGVDVDIAVIDTGIDLDHPDLKVHASTDCTAGGPMNDTCNDGDGDDGNGHGTHVAGSAAALDNSEGVVGVAPGSRLWAVKVLGDDGSGWLSDIIAGVDWVTSHADEIEVANMSLGGSGVNDSFRTAIQNSVDAGVFYAVAAGNDEKDVYGSDGTFETDDDVIPAAYPEVAAISAMADSDGEPGGDGSDTSYGSDDSFATFSNFSRSVVDGNPVSSPGAAIDLLLPGVEIYSTYKDGGYETYSGTSMSSPHGAGLAGLYIVANNLTPDSASDVHNIRQALIDDGVVQDSEDGLATLDDPDDNWENIGWASSATGDPPTVSWVNPSDGEEVSGSVTIQIDASDTEDDAGSLTVEWQVDGGTWHTATYNSDSGYYEDTWDSTQVSDGEHTLNAEATDSDGNTVNASITVTTENTDNAPTVSWANPQDGDTVSGSTTIQIDASDDKDSGSDLTVEWQVATRTWRTASYSTSTGYYEDNWNTDNVDDGDYDLTARATDSSDQSATSVITVTVDNSTGNSAPEATINDFSEVDTPSPHAKFSVSWEASDADGNLDSAELTLFDDTDNETEASETIDISGGSASGTTELKAKHDDGSGNEYTVELLVTDTESATDSDSATTTEQ